MIHSKIVGPMESLLDEQIPYKYLIKEPCHRSSGGTARIREDDGFIKTSR